MEEPRGATPDPDLPEPSLCENDGKVDDSLDDEGDAFVVETW
jgi:hypothetical protein